MSGAGAREEVGGSDAPTTRQAKGVDDGVRAGDAGGNANGGAMPLVEAKMEGTCSTANKDDRGFGGLDSEERLRVVVPSLLGYGLEGVFRTVVGFL